MKNYHTATQEDYNALMIELENKGCMWYEEKPTAKNYWPKNEEKTYVMEENGYLTYGRMEPSYRELYSKEPFIDYKAKGENMLNTECKQCHKKWHHDNAKYCSMCGKRLDEQPEFKVGDYVTDTSDDDPFICKIERIEGIDISGRWYCVSKNYFDKLVELPMPSSRLSTPEEVKLYESALNFYNHGREPFEVRIGDLVQNASGHKHIITMAFNNKDLFLLNNTKLLATAEEIDEWLGADDE